MKTSRRVSQTAPSLLVFLTIRAGFKWGDHVACFEKGSHVLLLFLSCFVSWSKTTALLLFCRVRGKRKGWQKSGVGS